MTQDTSLAFSSVQDKEFISENTIINENMESIDYISEEQEELDSLSVNIEEIQPGFIGWVKYGGNYIPGKVLSRNKRKKTAYVWFFKTSGFESNKQLISIFDLFHFGDQEQNDLIIAGCELKREKYLNALYEKGEEESEIDWLMWY